MKIVFYGDSITEGKAGVSYIKKIRKDCKNHEIINLGKGGDTVISLYKRIIKNNLDIPSDIAFVWIGTNDVFVKVSWLYYPIKIICNQRPSKNHEEINYYYKKIIHTISKKVKKVICVPPVLVGENLENKWNLELEVLSNNIKKISESFSKTIYLDLRDVFVKRLKNKKSSNYVIKSNFTMLLDTIRCNNTNKINKISKKRGLSFTLDGVHLNEKGAEIVSEEFLKIISKT